MKIALFIVSDVASHDAGPSAKLDDVASIFKSKGHYVSLLGFEDLGCAVGFNDPDLMRIILADTSTPGYSYKISDWIPEFGPHIVEFDRTDESHSAEEISDNILHIWG